MKSARIAAIFVLVTGFCISSFGSTLYNVTVVSPYDDNPTVVIDGSNVTIEMNADYKTYLGSLPVTKVFNTSGEGMTITLTEIITRTGTPISTGGETFTLPLYQVNSLYSTATETYTLIDTFSRPITDWHEQLYVLVDDVILEVSPPDDGLYWGNVDISDSGAIISVDPTQDLVEFILSGPMGLGDSITITKEIVVPAGIYDFVIGEWPTHENIPEPSIAAVLILLGSMRLRCKKR